jgi:hypothetical protein
VVSPSNALNGSRRRPLVSSESKQRCATTLRSFERLAASVCVVSVFSSVRVAAETPGSVERLTRSRRNLIPSTA